MEAHTEDQAWPLTRPCLEVVRGAGRGPIMLMTLTGTGSLKHQMGAVIYTPSLGTIDIKGFFCLLSW